MSSGSQVFIAAALVTLAFASTVQAQNGAIQVRVSNSAAATREHSVMVSVIRDSIVRQGETVVPTGRRFDDLAPGVYDVRVEGAGIVTDVKRGVHVFAGQLLNLDFVLAAGVGARVTEYATGGLSREEVATRLQHLEAAVADLQRATPARPGRPN